MITAIKERPILMNGPMVRAILACRKSQTRRPIKRQLPSSKEIKQRSGTDYGLWMNHRSSGQFRVVGPVWAVRELDPELADKGITCPYGVPGDRLWVRETWQSVPYGPHRDWPGVPDTRPWKTCEWNRAAVVIYRADGPMPGDEIWRPSIHMPRWASRITLEITDVKVERLNQISEADAIAEGCPGQRHVPEVGGWLDPPSLEYRRLWDSINGKTHPWESNFWVWALTFRRLEAA